MLIKWLEIHCDKLQRADNSDSGPARARVYVERLGQKKLRVAGRKLQFSGNDMKFRG